MWGGEVMASVQFISMFKVHEYLLGRPPSHHSFFDRLTVQKMGYLVQCLGVYLGEFNWNWYKFGPYSSAFTRVLYEISDINPEEFSSISSNYTLTEEIKETLSPFIKVIHSRPDDLHEAKWLELLASTLYIYRETTTQFDVCYDIIHTKKPEFTYKQFQHAWFSLEELELVK